MVAGGIKIMYIDTYNTNNEDERFKKYVEILKSHDQLKN